MTTRAGRLALCITRERIAVAALVILAALVRAPTLGQPLLEAHEFRQTQTAYTALLFAQDGIDLLHPRVPVLGPPYEVPFELPLFQALATFPMWLGLPPDVSLRITGLACFLVAAFLLWSLVRRLASAEAAFATLVAFLFSPLALLWSRAAMIDYLAVAAALGYLLAGIVWRDGSSRLAWAIALAAGVVAMTVKIQAAAFWILPLVAYRARRRERADPWLLALILVPLAAALLWTRYADAVRAASPGTAWMSAIGLAPFLFGSLAERVSPVAWARIGVSVAAFACGPTLAGLAVFAVPAIRAGAQRLFWSAFVASPLASILLYFHVWRVHDYYAIAATPSVAVAVGLAATYAWRRRGSMRIAGRNMLAAFAALIVVGLVATADYWDQAYESISATDDFLSRAAELDAFTTPSENVLFVGADWSPAVLYYARRHGQMLPAPLLTASFLSSLRVADYSTFFSWQPAVDDLWATSAWHWVGARAPHTYALGDVRSDLRDARVASSDDPSAFAGAAGSGRSLIDHSISVRCGAVSEVPAGANGTWLRLAPASRDARVSVLGSGLGALPVRAVLVTSSAVTPGRTIRLGCAGADALTVIAAVDAP